MTDDDKEHPGFTQQAYEQLFSVNQWQGTLEQLKQAHRELGAGLSPETQQRKLTAKVQNLYTAPRAFQPRMDLDGYEIKKHIQALADSILRGNTMTPLLVYAIGGKRLVIDGHCRLEAYKAAARKNPNKNKYAIPIRFFGGDFNQALKEAAKLNSADKQKLTREEKSEMAWRLVKHGFVEGDCYTSRELEVVTDVSKSQIHVMQQKLKELLQIYQSKTPEEQEELDHPLDLTWSDILRERWKKSQEEWQMEEKREQIIEGMKDRLLKTFGNKPVTLPDLFMEAVHRAYPKIAEEEFEDEEGLDF